MKKSYKITILGCGSSSGVPTIENGWGNCNPTNPKNIRTRTSALLTVNYHSNTSNNFKQIFNILFDVSPDFRQQALNNHIQQIDTILFTHHHADHIYGIDDLRSVNRLMQKPIPAYATAETLQAIQKTHYYIFNRPNPTQVKDIFYKPVLDFHKFDYYNTLTLNKDIIINTTLQNHGKISSAGFIIDNKIGYITDFITLPEKTLSMYKNLELIIIAGVTLKPHPSHMSIYEILDIIKLLTPKQAIITHMSEQLDYDFLQELLPNNVVAGYDGLVENII
ncbi:Metallo-beta-lactamase [Candidatus Hepatincola sp. Pdp]